MALVVLAAKLQIMTEESGPFCRLDDQIAREGEMMTKVGLDKKTSPPRETTQSTQGQGEVEQNPLSNKKDPKDGVWKQTYPENYHGVLENVEHSESWDPVRIVPMPKETHTQPCASGSYFSKLVPKQVNGRKFIRRKDLHVLRSALINSFLRVPKHNCVLQLRKVPGDPNSWLLQVHTHESEFDSCRKGVKEWLFHMRTSFNAKVLAGENGRDIKIELDPSLVLGERDFATLENQLLLVPSPDGVCRSINALKPAMRRGGVLLLEVDGSACTSMDHFNELRKVAQRENRTLCLICREPDPERPLKRKKKRPRPVQEEAERFSLTDAHAKQTKKRKTNNDAPTKDQSEAASRLIKEKLQAGYNEFKLKYKPVAEIEFKGGVDMKIMRAVSLMWKSHKMHFGKTCDETCQCAFSMTQLAENVIRDEQKEHPKWTHPNMKGCDGFPIGFINRFCFKFMGPLREEHPADGPRAIIERLCDLWKRHESNLSFGTKCRKTCDCIETFETVFNKGFPGKAKQTAVRKNGVRDGSVPNIERKRPPQPTAHISSISRDVSSKKSKKRKIETGERSDEPKIRRSINPAIARGSETKLSSGKEQAIKQKPVPASTDSRKKEKSSHSEQVAPVPAPTHVPKKQKNSHNAQAAPFSGSSPSVPKKEKQKSHCYSQNASSSADSGKNSSASDSLIGTMPDPFSVARSGERKFASDSPERSDEEFDVDAEVDTEYPEFAGIQHISYNVAFKTDEAMGYYFVTVITPSGSRRCRVDSVSPSATGRDKRIQKGTIVMQVKMGQERRPIRGHQDMERNFLESRRAGQNLRVFFVNVQSDMEAALRRSQRDSLHGHNRDWTEWGKWRGANDGWAGGAIVVKPMNQKQNKRAQGAPDLSMKEEAKNTDDGSSDIEWSKENLLRPIVRTAPKSIIAGARKRRGDIPILGKKRIQFRQENQKRQYEKGSETSVFHVKPDDDRSRPAVMPTACNDPAIAAAEKRGQLQQAIESGSFMDVLRSFEQLAAFALQTPDFLVQMRNSIAGMRNQPDFAKKDKILKIYVNALDIARNARALKYWVRVAIKIEEIVLNFGENFEALPGDEFMTTIKVTRSENGRTEEHMLKNLYFCGNGRIEISMEDQITPANFSYNDELDPLRMLDIEIRRKSKASSRFDETIGSAEFLVKDLYRDSVANQEYGIRRTAPITVTPHPHKRRMLERDCEVMCHVKCAIDENYLVEKRKNWSGKLNEVVDWITRFNKEDLTAQEKSQCIFSFEAPIYGTTLLESAILLADDIQVPRLIERKRAIVNVRVSDLAEAEAAVEDCLAEQRKNIARLIWQRSVKNEV